MKLRLFTTLYAEKNLKRQIEYHECLNRNLACAEITELCLLVEGEEVEVPESPKVRLRRVAHRPTYQDYFAWINEVAGADDVSIIANTDIWFDGSIGVARQRLGARECYALARWDGESLWDRNDSQDCWVFRGQIEGVRGDFLIGVVRCDNRILFELQEAGYRVLNPAFSIRARKCHEGERAEYGATEAHFIQPPYRYLWPHNLLGPVATVWHNLRFPQSKLGWQLDRRKLQRTWPARVMCRLCRG